VVTSKEVAEAIFNFAQRCFIGEKGKVNLNMAKEKGLFEYLSNGELTQIQAHQMSENHRKLLRELLTQYIMFLQMNPELPFPPNFLKGSNENLISNEIQPSESSLPGVGHRPPQPPRVGWAARADQSAD